MKRIIQLIHLCKSVHFERGIALTFWGFATYYYVPFFVTLKVVTEFHT